VTCTLILRIMTLCWSVRISLAFCLLANVSLFVLRVFSNVLFVLKIYCAMFLSDEHFVTRVKSISVRPSRKKAHACCEINIWRTVFFVIIIIFLLLLLSNVISYLSFMAVIWQIKVYILIQYTNQLFNYKSTLYIHHPEKSNPLDIVQ